MNNKLIGVFLGLLGIVVLPQSAIDLKNSLSTSAPTPISFDQFTADLPTEGWFKLKGAQLENTEALYVDDDGKIGNIYVPARAKGTDLESKEPVRVLVRIADASTRQFLEKAKQLDAKSDAEATAFLIKNSDKLQVEREVQGTLADGFDSLDDKEKRALQLAEANLSPDFVILQEGATPSIGGRVFLLLAALGLVVGGAVMCFKKS